MRGGATDHGAVVRVLRRQLRPARRVQAGLPAGGAGHERPARRPRIQRAVACPGRERVPDRGGGPLSGPCRGGPWNEEPGGRRRAGANRAVPLQGDRHRHGCDHRQRHGDLRGASDLGGHACGRRRLGMVRRRGARGGARGGLRRRLPVGRRGLGRGRRRPSGGSWSPMPSSWRVRHWAASPPRSSG